MFSSNSNPEAIKMIEKEIKKGSGKVDFEMLAFNKNGLHILLKDEYKDLIKWSYVSQNENAISFLEKNKNKISYYDISFNPAIFELDYKAMSNNPTFKDFEEELIAEVLKPSRVFKYTTDSYDYLEELFGYQC